ncbi:uncharacterized protein TOT_010000721 [Theileria orientalis strain Shintoku]|uniref:F-box domain-containing protein n=1 Tax=Theileria orientalis strain Shintoku TaxID=869250 RepID=J4CCE7_THEOR|nr:uncharacterized protein TOT_010000721 [Theileria orientalis strain Shintoku]BAM39262.1 uncharacterized protein TOT_010000721 [Theileria orientalis strain Shintoku]|eukprot:XP_009689563.1 uncharacterized protein TOT_010000721 [Theileria orientalis strain Shintoku]
MDNALVRFIGLAPKDVIELICNYLDFSEFLALTSVSRYVRSLLVNHHLFWLNYYMKRVNFRHYEADLWVNEKGTSKYQLRMPSFDKRQGISDPANRLLSSARKVEIMNTDTALSTNPMLNLSILDNFKRSRWRGEYKQYTENLSRFILPTMVVPTMGCNPFLLVSNSSVCGFNMNEDKFMFNNFMAPQNERRRHEIKLCSWVRLDDVSYTEEANFRSVTSRANYVPKILVIVYRTGGSTLAMSFYCYDGTSFVNVPSMALKMSIDEEDYVSAIDVYGLLQTWDGREVVFSNINIFVGTARGVVLQKRMERDKVAVERKEQLTTHEITTLRFVSWHSKAVLVAFSHGNYLGAVDVSNDEWSVAESINDPVVTFSIDAPNCLMAFSTSVHNRSTYVDLYNANSEKAHYLVPKPPFRILSLERDSKWAIVIRNYIRVLQVIHPNERSTSGKQATYKHCEDISSEDSSNEYASNALDWSHGSNWSNWSSASNSYGNSGYSTYSGYSASGATSGVGVDVFAPVESASGAADLSELRSTSGLNGVGRPSRAGAANGTGGVVDSMSAHGTATMIPGEAARGASGSNLRGTVVQANTNEPLDMSADSNTINVISGVVGANGADVTITSYPTNAAFRTVNGRRGTLSRCNSSQSMSTASGLSRVNSSSSINGVNVTYRTQGQGPAQGSALGETETYLQRLSIKANDERGEPSSQKLKFKSLCTLNGHLSDITHCAHDGWSKLVTIDSGHNLFVWDYTIGCKIFSFSLLADMKRNVSHGSYAEEFEGKNKKCVFKRTDSRCSLKSDSTEGAGGSHRRGSEGHRRSLKLMNRVASSSDLRDAIEDYLYLDASDFDASPLSDDAQRASQRPHRAKNSVPASSIKGLLDPNKKGQKYYVDVSVQSLIVYYKSCNVMQVWSFK